MAKMIIPSILLFCVIFISTSNCSLLTNILATPNFAVKTITVNPASNALGELLSVEQNNNQTKSRNGSMSSASNPGFEKKDTQTNSATKPKGQINAFKNRFDNDTTCVPSVTVIPGQDKICKEQLIFEENFNTEALDMIKWKHDCHIPTIDMDNEFVTYQAKSENIFVMNGTLMIRPTTVIDKNFVESGELDLTKTCSCVPTPFGECSKKAMFYNILPPIVSASIRSNFSFKYGRIQIDAKLPEGNWLYPVLNLEPKDYNHGPGYKSGAIRIAFARGNKILKSQGANYDFGSTELSGALLYKNENPVRNISAKVYKNVNEDSWTNDFHKYELEWTPYHVCFIVDEIKYGVILPPKHNSMSGRENQDVTRGKNWKNHMSMFSEMMKVRLGVAAGGITDFPDDISTSTIDGHLEPKPWENFNPKSLLRFWQDQENWERSWKSYDSNLVIRSVKIWAV